MTGIARNGVTIAFSLRPEGNSGVQTHTRLLHEGIAEAGIECSLETPFSGSKWWLPVFAVRPLILAHLHRDWSTRWHRYWHMVALRRSLKRRVMATPPEVVVAQCAPTAMAALDVRRELGASFRIALVCHFTVSEAEELLEKGHLRDPRARARIAEEERHAIENVDLVVHDSEWQRKTIEGARGLRPRSSTVIWHGIPTQTASRTISRASLGYAADDVVLVNVGSIEPRKNQLGLIDTYTYIASRFPRAKLLLVGGDGPHRRAVERRIAEDGLADRVKLLVDCPDVPSALACGDVYVHFATIESFGLVLLEAARAGLPVSAVPAGGAAEVLERLGGTALDPTAPERCWQALRPLLEDALHRRAMGRRALRNFEQYFTRDRMIDSYLRALGFVSDVAPAQVAKVQEARVG